MLTNFSIFLTNWESLFIFETFIFTIIILILLFVIIKKISLLYYTDEDSRENKIIIKLKKEKNRLLDIIHENENTRDNKILEIQDEWWSKTADIESCLKYLSNLTYEMRKKQGNNKLSEEANAIIKNFIKTLKNIL